MVKKKIKENIKNKNLETVTNNSSTPVWKQYVPVYGCYRVVKDNAENKPSLMDDKYFLPGTLYHIGVSYIPTGYAILQGLAKLFE